MAAGKTVLRPAGLGPGQPDHRHSGPSMSPQELMAVNSTMPAAVERLMLRTLSLRMGMRTLYGELSLIHI